MARIANNFDIQLVDASGNALSSGTIQFYQAGTSTPKNTYPTQSDAQAQTNANPNPITCDSQGRPNNSGLIDIWLLTDTAYKVVIKDSTGTTVRTIDNYSGTFDPNLGDYTSKNIKFADNDGIQDSNGNEVIDVVKAASAVNFIQAKNSGTGDDVELAAAGTDTNVSLNLNPKGSGLVKINSAFGFPNSDGSANQYMKTDGSGNLSWTSLSVNSDFPKGYISGFTCQQSTDTDHDINFGAGVCRDSGDTNNIDSSAIIKQLDANWAEGNAAGGKASAVTLSANLTIHGFVIAKTDGTTDAGFDTSLTATNLLSDATGYTLYRRIIALRLDASSNLRDFVMYPSGEGYHLVYDTPTLDVNTTITTSESSFNMASIPNNVALRCDFNTVTSHASQFVRVIVRNPDITDTAPSASAAPLHNLDNRTGGGTGFSNMTIWTNSSGQIAARSDNSATTFRVVPLGYFDPRQS